MSNSAKRQKQQLAASGSRTAQRQGKQSQNQRLLLQRAQMAPGSLRPEDVHAVQRAIGNQATGRLLARGLSIQAKMEVGPVNDVHEQEADRMAREVVRRTSSPQAIGENNALGLQRQPLAAGISGVQRAEEDELAMKRDSIQRQEEDELAMKRDADPAYRDGGALDGTLEKSIRQAKGGGHNLHPTVMRQMESGFGASFGGVRIHTDASADKLTRSVHAKAFTTGNDIFFKRGEYNPGSSAGRELLAHELTHTVQQGAARVQRKLDRRAFRA